jgi:hypothetical protein
MTPNLRLTKLIWAEREFCLICDQVARARKTWPVRRTSTQNRNSITQSSPHK